MKQIERNNLQELDAEFPLGVLTTVTGVSGSGKSSLVSQALIKLVGEALGQKRTVEAPNGEVDLLERELETSTGGRIVDGMEHARRLVTVDQKPIGRTSRSNLATYTGLFDRVRKLFAATRKAKSRRYDVGRFSFNVSKGCCANCEGAGFVSVELRFLPSVYTPCPVCQGQRYNDKTLEITYRDKNIAEVLDLTVESAHQCFADETPILRALDALLQVGLGYLRLGQPATQRSGGEAQRIKLATELQRTQRGDTLYVLDEPTTGLHPADVALLRSQLSGLVDAGNTVVAVEHNMRLATESDWIIDIGPGAGNEGGLGVAQGTPAKVAESRQVARHHSLPVSYEDVSRPGLKGSGPSVALREGPNGGWETPQGREEGRYTPWRRLLDRGNLGHCVIVINRVARDTDHTYNLASGVAAGKTTREGDQAAISMLDVVERPTGL